MIPKRSYKFERKWSKEISLNGHTSVPNLLIINQSKLNVTNGELIVLIGLMQHMWTEKPPYPAVSTLARQSGMASKTVRNHIRNLEKKSLIKRVYRKSSTNIYDFDPLKKKLNKLALTTKKSTRPSPISSNYPYPIFSSKKEELNNTKIRRGVSVSDFTHIKNVISNSYKGHL